MHHFGNEINAQIQSFQLRVPSKVPLSFLKPLKIYAQYIDAHLTTRTLNILLSIHLEEVPGSKFFYHVEKKNDRVCKWVLVRKMSGNAHAIKRKSREYSAC